MTFRAVITLSQKTTDASLEIQTWRYKSKTAQNSLLFEHIQNHNNY